MTLRDLLDAVNATFGYDDLARYYGPDGRRNGATAPPVADFLITRVTTTYDGRACKENDGDAVLGDVLADLRQAANQINSCVPGLVASVMSALDTSVLQSRPAVESQAAGAAEDRSLYLWHLGAFHQIALRLGCDPERADPGGRCIVAELRMLPAVVDLLDERRERVRQALYPVGDGSRFIPLISEFGVDRADALLAYYRCHVVREFGDDPANWTIRGDAATVRDTLVSVLPDLRHLADSAGIAWADLLAAAEHSYLAELGDDRGSADAG